MACSFARDRKRPENQGAFAPWGDARIPGEASCSVGRILPTAPSKLVFITHFMGEAEIVACLAEGRPASEPVLVVVAFSIAPLFGLCLVASVELRSVAQGTESCALPLPRRSSC